MVLLTMVTLMMMPPPNTILSNVSNVCEWLCLKECLQSHRQGRWVLLPLQWGSLQRRTSPSAWWWRSCSPRSRRCRRRWRSLSRCCHRCQPGSPWCPQAPLSGQSWWCWSQKSRPMLTPAGSFLERELAVMERMRLISICSILSTCRGGGRRNGAMAPEFQVGIPPRTLRRKWLVDFCQSITFGALKTPCMNTFVFAPSRLVPVNESLVTVLLVLEMLQNKWCAWVAYFHSFALWALFNNAMRLV